MEVMSRAPTPSSKGHKAVGDHRFGIDVRGSEHQERRMRIHRNHIKLDR